MEARTQYALLSAVTFLCLTAIILGLTLGLATEMPDNGGSPDGPPRMENDTQMDNIQSEDAEDTYVGFMLDQGMLVNSFHGRQNKQNTNQDGKYPKDYVDENTQDGSVSDVNEDDLVEFELEEDTQHDHGSSDIDTDDTLQRGPSHHSEYSPFGQFRFAAISADADPCSSIGVEILATKGGSSVDAAIATMLCVGVVNCQSSGIGGGHFMTIIDYPNDGSEERVWDTILARERAPLNSSRDMYINTTWSSTVGGKAIAVPGEIKGFYRAWQLYGRVPWEELFEPTIQLCQEGHLVNGPLASSVSQYEAEIRADSNLGELFIKEDGSLVQEGDILFRPKLARTLGIIAEDPNAFYDPTSQLAKDIIADIRDYDGIITMEDLEVYEVYRKDPLIIHLQNGNMNVLGARPPSSGVVLQYILNILDEYNFTQSDLSDSEQTILTYHRMAEAFKFAYAKRSELGDEEFVEGIEELLKNLTSDEYADAIRLRINETHTQDVQYYEPAFDIVEDSGTAHASIFGPDGSAVAITATINLFFGSNVRGTRTGIFFNNEMDDFSTPGTVNDFGVPASPANYIVPYKMPMSSMCPTLFVDGDGVVRFISGAAGGTRITTSTSFVAMNSLWFDIRVDNATDIPRLHHQLVPNELSLEDNFDQELKAGLANKGHTFTERGIGNVYSIHNTCSPPDSSGLQNEEQCIHASGDKRKSGTPDGY